MEQEQKQGDLYIVCGGHSLRGKRLADLWNTHKAKVIFSGKPFDDTYNMSECESLLKVARENGFKGNQEDYILESEALTTLGNFYYSEEKMSKKWISFYPKSICVVCGNDQKCYAKLLAKHYFNKNIKPNIKVEVVDKEEMDKIFTRIQKYFLYLVYLILIDKERVQDKQADKDISVFRSRKNPGIIFKFIFMLKLIGVACGMGYYTDAQKMLQP